MVKDPAEMSSLLKGLQPLLLELSHRAQEPRTNPELLPVIERLTRHVGALTTLADLASGRLPRPEPKRVSLASLLQHHQQVLQFNREVRLTLPKEDEGIVTDRHYLELALAGVLTFHKLPTDVLVDVSLRMHNERAFIELTADQPCWPANVIERACAPFTTEPLDRDDESVAVALARSLALVRFLKGDYRWNPSSGAFGLFLWFPKVWSSSATRDS